ncbi:hypothetical protein [Nonomuraea polychroma]|uniref:hypothetical protein n=1 Tax=Nonomuraea polychroma TaxID=46176 RepID=UPI0019D4EDD3|nr:hypothetical protein [Nonomuraea polychroma]
MTARLRDLDQDLDHLRITRKTLLVLAGEPRPASPPPPAPAVPDHPAYQQILTLMADTGQPSRARDLCLALDLPLARKNIENTRASSSAWSAWAFSWRSSRDCSLSRVHSLATSP